MPGDYNHLHHVKGMYIKLPVFILILFFILKILMCTSPVESHSVTLTQNVPRLRFGLKSCQPEM